MAGAQSSPRTLPRAPLFQANSGSGGHRWGFHTPIGRLRSAICLPPWDIFAEWMQILERISFSLSQIEGNPRQLRAVRVALDRRTLIKSNTLQGSFSGLMRRRDGPKRRHCALWDWGHSAARPGLCRCDGIAWPGRFDSSALMRSDSSCGEGSWGSSSFGPITRANSRVSTRERSSMIR